MTQGEKEPQPPLLFDVIVSGDQVREAGGPWLGEAGERPHREVQPAAVEAPQASTAPPVDHDAETLTQQLRAEIERQVGRELAKQVRSELERQLPQALREAQRVLRKAIDNALLDAVATTRAPAQSTAQPPTPENPEPPNRGPDGEDLQPERH